MQPIRITTEVKRMLADVFTPVGIYLRLRDRFRDTILLESTDHHVAENSYSFICINAVAGMEIFSLDAMETKLPGEKPVKASIADPAKVPDQLWAFMKKFDAAHHEIKEAKYAQGFFGYTCYDAVQFFDTIRFDQARAAKPLIPFMRYRLYQYVIVVNHYKDELFLCENKIAGLESDLGLVESLIRSKDVPVYPFATRGEEEALMSDEAYMDMVKKGIQHCMRGDSFQIVLSRRFQQPFRGDEFNVYRALRSINPSPYLFYFDYGDYRLMGSSPESQILLQQGRAIVHPIAGTFRRTGHDDTDQALAEKLLADAKENAEHVMLVDLARNDLSQLCDDVSVSQYREVQYYSHVIHLVSEVTGKLRPAANPFQLLARTFPAGTLSGAPKFRAMELIDQYEPVARSYYGGAIGYMGFDGTCIHAIMIRTLLSLQNRLVYQAGAGIVAASDPASELQEVNNKLGALKKAILFAENLGA